MKFVFVILFFQCLSVNALRLTSAWEKKDVFSKVVTLTCEQGDQECRQFCGQESECRYQEKPCRNCLGSGLKMTYVFTEMGRSYRNDGISYRWDYVFDLLRSEKFVSLTSKSIYNHVTRFNALSMRRRFNALCQDKEISTPPLVLFSVDKLYEIASPQYVVCGHEVFGLIHDPQLSLDDYLD